MMLSSPNAFVGDPVPSCNKSAALDPRLRGEDERFDMDRVSRGHEQCLGNFKIQYNWA